jgi:hypothetical protein
MRRVVQRNLSFLARNEFLNQIQGGMCLDSVSFRNVMNSFVAAKTGIPLLGPLTPITGPFAAIPSTLQHHITTIEASQPFIEAFAGLSYSFGYIPLASLIPVQTFVNLDNDPVRDVANDLEVLKYCLPEDFSVPHNVIPTMTGFRFVTPRYGMGSHNIRRRIENGNVVLSFEHVNLVQVQRIGDKLILTNGIHRCFKLLSAGLTHVPALIVQRSSVEEVENLNQPGVWTTQFIFSHPRPPHWGPRPPILSDFLSPIAVDAEILLGESIIDLSISMSSSINIQISK